MATIKKQGRGYKITVSNGYDIHGKQIRHHLTWVPESNLTERQVERELNRQIVLFEESVKTGGIRLDGNIRFQAFSERFMRDHIAVNRKPNTAARYERDLKRINKAIGHMKLSHITPSDINAFAASLQADGAKGAGGKLAPLLCQYHPSDAFRSPRLRSQVGLHFFQSCAQCRRPRPRIQRGSLHGRE